MQLAVKLPCSVREMENALHRVAYMGYWDTARITADVNEISRESSIIITYGKEQENDNQKENCSGQAGS